MGAKTDRQIPVFVLFLITIIIAFNPIALSSPGYVVISSDVNFRSSSSYGEFLFDSDFRTTQIAYDGEYVQFSNLRPDDSSYAWSSLGFSVNSVADMTLSDLTSTTLVYTVNAPTGNLSTTKIVLPNSDYPTSIEGADSYEVSGTTIIINVTHTSPAVITFIWGASVFGTETQSDFIDTLSTDFLGGAISIYTDVVGPIFWVFIAFFMLVPHVNRIGVLPMVVILGLVWGLFRYVLPAQALNIIYVIILLAGTVALVVLFFSRRRQYG